MIKTGLTYLLLISIVVQSLFAVANNQEIHQLDTEHLIVEHSHLNDKQTKPISLTTLDFDTGITLDTGTEDIDTEHNIEDCHHCGHCHGSHAQWLALNHRTQLINNDEKELFIYQSQLNIGTQENPLRPPIA